MKYFPTFFICITVLFLLESPVSAQNGNSNQESEISLNVSARVFPTTVELITIQSMNLAGIEAENDIITINPITSGNAGKMIAIGNANSEINISFIESRELVRNQGNETLTFYYTIAGNTIDDQSTSEILDRDNRELNFNSEGQFYLWIGGSVDISTAAPGSYQGEFTIEIEYI